MKFLGIKRVILGLLVMNISGSLFSQNESSVGSKNETKFSEVVFLDSVPSKQILERAVNWAKLETPKYVKSNRVSSGSRVECIATFTTKPKQLNPEFDYTGKITMKVSIEVKDGKYRYTINNIQHKSNSGKVNGGSIDNIVPESGSMAMDEITWKKIKGEAIRNAQVVISDIKEFMIKENAGKQDEW
ncbi:MAG: DUF4468 domain-containing protein [Bacteroidia bacterium]|nr:DUF4468 domain-containing protein [Bacteroidia bacterium]